MSTDRIAEQLDLAKDLADMLQTSGHDVQRADLLDDLASCGLKLKRLIPEDFDQDGISVVSYAYLECLKGEPSGT